MEVLAPLGAVLGTLLPIAWAASKGWSVIHEKVAVLGHDLTAVAAQLASLREAAHEARLEVSVKIHEVSERVVRTETRVRSLEHSRADYRDKGNKC